VRQSIRIWNIWVKLHIPLLIVISCIISFPVGDVDNQLLIHLLDRQVRCIGAVQNGKTVVKQALAEVVNHPEFFN